MSASGKLRVIQLEIDRNNTVKKGGKMTKGYGRNVVAVSQHWADLSELLRLHRGLVKSFYQNTGRAVQEQFRIKQLHFSGQPGMTKLAVG